MDATTFVVVLETNTGVVIWVVETDEPVDGGVSGADDVPG